MDNNISIRDLAPEAGLHHTNLRTAMKRGGFPIVRMRAPSGQMLDVVTRKTADRFLAERRASGYVGKIATKP
jgi:hypothetical protein